MLTTFQPLLPVRSFGTFQDRGRWLVPTLALIAALGIGGFIGAKPAWRFMRARRATRLLSEAEVLAGQKKWAEVAPLMKSSLVLLPGDLRGYRLAARYFTAMNSSQALVYWRHIIATGTATYVERRNFCELAISMGRPDLARPILTELAKEQPRDPELQRVALVMARRLKMDDLLVLSSERWLRIEPTAPEPQYELGALRWRSGDRTRREEGRQMLWGLAFASNAFTMSAINALAAGTNISGPDRDLLWRRLDNLASTNVLAVADVRLRLRPREREAVVRQVVDLLKPDSGLAEVTTILKWLSDHGAVAETLVQLTPERLARMPALETARIEALIEVGRADEIQSVLDSPPKNIPPHLIHCLRASAAHFQGRKDMILQHLEQAAANTGKQLTANLTVARYAERLNQPRVALTCWQQIARDFGGGMDASMQIVRLARELDDLPAVQPALAALRSQMTTDVGVVLSADYVDALLGRLRPDLMPQLREIARTNTPMVMITAVWALAEWKTGDPMAALRVLESTTTDWTKVEPRFQAVYVAVLGAAGQREAARLAAHRVPTDRLSREEKELLEPWQ